MRGREVRSGHPRTMHFFGGVLCTRVDRYRAPHLHATRSVSGSSVRGFAAVGGERRGSSIQSVKRHRIDRGQLVEAGWVARSRLAVERCAAYPQHNGRNTFRFGVEHGQPPADEPTTWTGSVGLGFILLKRRRCQTNKARWM